jgi:hypothetical protein
MNPITGESLSADQRVFAGIGLLSLGTLSWFKFAPKMIKKILKGGRSGALLKSLTDLKNSLLNGMPLEKGHRFIKNIMGSARKLGLKTKYQIKDLADYLGDNF